MRISFARALGACLMLGFAVSARAQSSPLPRTASGATITGVVYDSIGHVPLDGATVQLVSSDGSGRVARTSISDSLGHFAVADVPPGRYSVGFFHPILETLGIEPPLSGISVTGAKSLRLDLGTPGVEHYREVVCGPEYASRPGAIVVGLVRDARDLSAVPGAMVSAQWMELTFTKAGTARKFPSAAATTASNGWFALCDLPSPGTISLRAIHGADSLQRLEIDIPETGVVRRELYFAPADGVADGRLSGRVLTAEGSRPVAGAKVAIIGGPETRTDERGAWTLIGAPYGTRTMEVRAIGFYPDREPVNVIADAAPIPVRLSTMRAVLDTIRVSANRIAYDASGFTQRKRIGVGKFLSERDIETRGGVVTSDIFRAVPGLTVDRNPNTGEPDISMRGPFGYCSPTVFLDGTRLPNIHGGDIDDIISLKKVKAVEIYSEASVPGEFKDFTRMDSCGSIVIWSK